VVTIQVDVVNRGAREAQETVFLFAHDKLASVSRPKLELKGFGKISLPPGGMGTVTLSLRAAELRFLGLDLDPVFEPVKSRFSSARVPIERKLLAASIQLVASCPVD